MTSKELVEHIDYLLGRAKSDEGPGPHAEASEFLRMYAGPKSSFYQELSASARYASHARTASIVGLLTGFRDYIQRGLNAGMSPERRAQIDVVSDMLGQSQALLEDRSVHPAAPIVLVGASLEEFLRTWCEGAGIGIGNAKPGLDAYAKALRTADLITSQDIKDITAWGGLRNAAAHGEWDQVKDPARARLMLEGVNLFMRKYSA
jgi:hypothetical protein